MGAPALTILGHVGPTSGNIRHDGDVRVFGCVLEDFRVEAEGNVLIARDVQNAQVVSGGDIVVSGLAGGEETELDAVGSVSVRHASDARIVAGLDIEVRALAERCRLTAGRYIRTGGVPGLIRGGVLRAGTGVEATRLESAAGRDAEVSVGRDDLEERRRELLERLGFAEKGLGARAGTGANGLAGIRKRIADARTWSILARTLRRRLAQIDRAGELRERPWFRVTGGRPAAARVSLGGARRPGAGEEAGLVDR